jgi:2'-5' RNA ligase
LLGFLWYIELMDQLKRVFIAIPLPNFLKQEIARKISPFLGINNGIRWLDQAGWHITLVPPQNWTQEQINQSISGLDSGKLCQKFSLNTEKICLAPLGKKPRMIWCVFQKQPRFNDLTELVIKNLQNQGLKIDKIRPITCIHATLARFPEAAIRVFNSISLNQDMTVDSIEIWQSQLLPTGAVYASLGEVRLG